MLNRKRHARAKTRFDLMIVLNGTQNTHVETEAFSHSFRNRCDVAEFTAALDPIDD